MKYTLTKEEIDMISEALKVQINYYMGWLCIYEQEPESEKRKQKEEIVREKIQKLTKLQEKTTYIGQDIKFK